MRRAFRVSRCERSDLPLVGPVGTGRPPVVSVVIATYNRSNVLRYTLASLMAQTVDDWEALVIGDRCTDDSEAVVTSFGDPRLTWLNLERGMGEQSGPNSIGARMARGRFIAWLNHDDLWVPDHLASLLATADGGPFDVVASGWLNVGPREGAEAAGGDGLPGIDAEAWNVRARTRLDPSGVYPASTWLMRRDVVQRVGDWRPAASLRAAPSQDYLYRCWALGATVHLGGSPSVVAIQSGRFAGSYADRREREHVMLAPLVAQYGPDEVATMLAARTPLVQLPRADRWREARERGRLVRTAVRDVAVRTLVPAGARLGVGPAEAKARLSGVPAGRWMSDLQEFRGVQR